MLIGILSDTHGDVTMARAAVHKLQERGVAYFIHCGDVCGESVLDALAGLPSAFVWGNNDCDRTSLARYAAQIGVICLGSYGTLELDGKQIAVIHGDDQKRKQYILTEQAHDYLLQGHTHVRADQRVGRTRIINPGALHRAATKSVALLDLQTDQLEFLQIGPSHRA